jgi:hypothetical protein
MLSKLQIKTMQLLLQANVRDPFRALTRTDLRLPLSMSTLSPIMMSPKASLLQPTNLAAEVFNTVGFCRIFSNSTLSIMYKNLPVFPQLALFFAIDYLSLLRTSI